MDYFIAYVAQTSVYSGAACKALQKRDRLRLWIGYGPLLSADSARISVRLLAA